MRKDTKKTLRRPLDQYQYKGTTAAKPSRSISEWAAEKIRQLTFATQQGNFPSARRLIDELEHCGLDHDGHQPMKIGLDTFLCEVFDVRTSWMLERELGVHTFRQLLQLPRSRLTEASRIGDGIVNNVVSVCRRHFGTIEQEAG